MREIIMLAILDGWGVGKKDEGNPLYMASTPALSFIAQNFPCGALQASGIAVGLPWEDAGSSEVGHLTLGAGKIIYQNYPRVSLSIRDGSFFENEKLKKFMVGVGGGSLHLVGLFSEHPLYSAKEHLFALLLSAEKAQVERVFVHLILDGDKDYPLDAYKKSISELKEKLLKTNGCVASVSGSYYSMNEDSPKNVATYAALTGTVETPRFENVESLLVASQAKNPALKFISPGIIEGFKPIASGDSLLFFNFEPGGIETLVSSFADKEFRGFERKELSGVSVMTLTKYGSGAESIFTKDEVKTPLGGALSLAQKSQMRIAETLKNRSLTFYFNGCREEPYPNEYRAIVPSKKTLSPVEHPEMMAETITERALMTLRERGFDFVALNYANPDVIARTGNYEATKRAAETVDTEIGKLLSATLQENHTLIIVGSHGNAEMLLDMETGKADIKNNPNPVPFYLVKSSMRKAVGAREHLPHIGLLSDVAPTILELMNIEKPKEMTGESLLSEL